MPSDSNLLLKIILYFILISTVLALTFGDEVSQIALQPTANYSISTADFVAMSNLSDVNHNIIDGDWNTATGRGIFSVLEYSTIGRAESRLADFLGKDPKDIDTEFYGYDIHAKNTIAFPDIKKATDTLYITNYSIYNPEHNRLKIYFFFGKLATFGRAGVLLDSEGFYLPISEEQGFIEGFSAKPFVNSTALNNSYLNFTTEFDTATNLCTFYYEGDLIFSEVVQPLRYELFSIVGNQHYFASVTAWGKDTEILDVDTTITQNIDELTTFSATDFFRTIIQFFVWDVPENIMPPMFKIVFFSIALFAIIFILLRFIRGIG